VGVAHPLLRVSRLSTTPFSQPRDRLEAGELRSGEVSLQHSETDAIEVSLDQDRQAQGGVARHARLWIAWHRVRASPDTL